MMFSKAVFALYLAAITLAAPGGAGDGGISKLRVYPCSLCTSLSTVVDVVGNTIANGVGDDIGIGGVNGVANGIGNNIVH
jgi:hypothetical protein